jgi:3-oxoacyl-[acyl-carrier protein] reductase
VDLGLADRVYILTGASRGLGFATARCLVADGARVVISARRADRLDEAVAALGGGDRVAGLAADLAAPDTPGRLLALAGERFGRLDGALVSVGGPPPGRASTIPDEQWRAGFETVFLGSVRAARTFADAMPDGGAVALVLSTSARAPVPNLGISNGLRPGLAGIAKELADEYAARGVRFACLLPGRIMTDRNRELFAATDDPARAAEEAAAQIPLRRLGAPEEFGRVGAFVLSPAASYLTGLSVPVDGGASRNP